MNYGLWIRKNWKLLIVLLLMFDFMDAQSQVPRPVPPVYPSTISKNYVRTWDATAPESNPNTLITRPLRDVKQNTQYFDGLGRQLQTVLKQGSINSYNPTNSPTFIPVVVDIIKPVMYDEFGREQFTYLPFASSATDATKNNGQFKLNPFQQQVAFYNTQLNGQTGEFNVGAGNLNWAYSQTKYEASPLNTVQEVFAPGSNWVGTSANATESSRRSIKRKYYANTVTDEVRAWYVSIGTLPAFSTYSTVTAPAGSPSVYAAGQLQKIITIDEKNNQVIEFKDKEGKVILKKVQLTATADNGTGSGHSGWLCTYYIYDNLNNLRCVIQPRGVEILEAANWADATVTTILPEQCFRYEYDYRSRMVIKKVPGADEVYMVYDVLDRLVMTQDAKMRTENKWLVTLYDNLDRAIQTGRLLNTFTSPAKTFVQHINAAKSSYAYPFAVATPSTITYWEYLTKTGYDDYTTIPAASGLNTTIDGTYNSTTYGVNTNYNVSPDYAQEIPVNASKQTRGMITWTETKVLNTTTYLYTVNLYDENGRVIQVKSKNITGGLDIATTQYNWAGQPLVVIYKQAKSGTPTQISEIITKMTYDDLGRLTQTDKKVRNTNVSANAFPANYTTVSKNEYDALGQLKRKKLGNKPGAPAGTALSVAEYDYNVRGWLLSVNKGYMNSTNADQYFAMELGYDKNASFGTFTPQYNGNIGGILWKGEGDQQKRKYNFSYDAVNRLTRADFTQYVTGAGTTATFNTSAGVDFSIGGNPATGGTMKYDANGNITEMWQTGLKINTSLVIDKLAYSYNTNNNSNRLLKVFDAVVPTTDNGKLGDFKDGSNGTGNDYTYDVNGNLTQDLNKGISSINYNHLNLPLVITVTGKGTITYTYDAAGNKQKKVTVENASAANNNITTTTTTTYIGGAVYESKTDNNAQTTDYTDRLQFIGHEEGRIRFKPENNTLHYDYMLKDHLGNVRMVLTEEQQQDQYPAATMEGTYSAAAPEATSMINYEKKFYTVNNTYVVNSSTMPGWTTGKDYANNNGNPPYNLSYPPGTTPAATATSAKVYRLNATTNKTGLGMVLKVMAGDKINIHGKSYYQSATTYNNTNSTALVLADLIGAFIGSPDNAGFIGKGISSPTMQTINTGQIPAGFFRGTDNTTSSVPKAYINYIFFDEQFKYAGGNFSRVGSSGTVKNHWFSDAQLQNIPVLKSGYLYVYVSNESNDNVFFDNLQVFHTRGRILEETHYYPFGLTMAGISSRALSFGEPKNKEQTFQEQRFDDDLGLNWIPFKWRSHDPQIGRFMQIDPLSHDYRHNSTYAFSENRVTDGRELEGLEYVSMHHYADGTIGTKMHYKSTDKEINKIHGTTADIYNSASYGSQGKGVVHYYYDNKGTLLPKETKWDQKQEGGSSDFAYHGLYSGPGSITRDGGESTNYDFSFQPIDWSDAIAKRHDMDYVAATATGEAYAGFLEDVRTVQADKDMVQRISDYGDLFKKVKGVETPYRTSWSGEMELSMKGQSVVISALATYKQWKIDNNYGNKDTYDKLRDDFRKENKAVAFIIDKIVNR